MPPSIINLTGFPPDCIWLSIAFLKSRTFDSISAINDCPPLPGTTLITSTRSSFERNGNTSDADVLGLRTIPA